MALYAAIIYNSQVSGSSKLQSVEEERSIDDDIDACVDYIIVILHIISYLYHSP